MKIVIVLFIFFFVICLNKLGIEKTFSWAIAVIPAMSIIVFNLSDCSIIMPVSKLFRFSHILNLEDVSIRVAIDCATITLLCNTLLLIFKVPMKIEVKKRTPQNLQQERTYCNKPIKVNYDIAVDFKYASIKKLYKKYGGVYLKIVNSKNTSIDIDKQEEYKEIIDCSNSSQCIYVNITEIPALNKSEGRIYITMVVVSDKTIDWDDNIYMQLLIGNKILSLFTNVLWEKKLEEVKLVHRGET